MTASIFNPFTATPSDLLAWLSQRNVDDDDLEADEVAPVAGLFYPNTGLHLADRVERILDLRLSFRMRKAYRTRANRIGLWWCDIAVAVDRATCWSALLVRVIVTVAVGVGGLLTGLGGSAAALMIAVWGLTAWRGRFAFPVTAVALATVAWADVSGLVYAGTAVLICKELRALLWFVRYQFITLSIVNSPVRFLGRAFIARALWDRTASSILLTVVKVIHEERARASLFIDDCLPAAPAVLRPVLVQCQALVALAKLEFQEALRLSEQARELAGPASCEIRGWCALQSGDVLLAAGQLGAAERRWNEAVELLRGSRRAAFWRLRAELRLVEAQTADLSRPERCLRGLQTLCLVRDRAIRRGDTALLRTTENYLLRLMHKAGNVEGIVLQLYVEHEMTSGRTEVGGDAADRASETLLLASLYLDVVEFPERYGDEVEVDESDPARYDYPVQLVDTALRQLSQSAEPLLEAHAYVVMARVQAAIGQREDALGNALESLNVVQRVRYQLPTTQWRSQWLAMHAHTYALALELAFDHGAAALVAELLETVRAQAIPIEADEPGALLRAAFDSLLFSTGLPLTAELAAEAVPVSTDPLQIDRTILVSGASWVGGDQSATIDLDRELDTMFPDGWYWSFAKVGDWVYHAVRTPNGKWFAERRSFADLQPSLSALLRLLPVEQEAGDKFDPALAAEQADVMTADGSVRDLWTRLFAELGAALIPLRLRNAVEDSAGLLKIVAAPTASLTLVPIAALSLDDGRHLLDIGYVAHLPSPALLAQRRAKMTNRFDPEGGPAEVLAVLAPHTSPDTADLVFVVSDPPLAERSLVGPLEKQALVEALADVANDDSVLYLAGHVTAPDGDDPASTGFEFADGPLGLHDLYRTEGGRTLYPIPDRVVLAGCSSLGLYGDASLGAVDAPEWLGLGAAMVYGGAQHVFCTLFDVPDTAHTSRIDRALVDAMRFRTEPARALRAIQRTELDRWLDGRGSMPLVFLAYAYVGIGQADGPGRGLTAR